MKDLEVLPQPLVLEEEPLRMVIYGEFGRGKTTLADSFPAPLFIDTNGGMVTLALHGRAPLRWEPTGHEDLEGLVALIRETILDDTNEYRTIVIDSLDSLVFLLMDEITADAVQEKQATGKKVSLRMQFVPEQGDHYGAQRQMQRFLVALRRLGMHIVITSGQRVTNGQSGCNVSAGMDKVVCDFASCIGEIVILDEVDPEDLEVYPDLYDGCRIVWFEEANSRSTKSRYESLKPFVVLPRDGGFDKIADLIEAEYAEAIEQQAPKPKTKARRAPAKKASAK
jgi:hypothetical protein